MTETNTHPNQNNDMIEVIINKALKYYDLTITILVVLVLLLDSFFINTLQQSFILIIGLLAILCVVTIIFDIDKISSVLQIKRIFNQRSKFTISNFFKALIYIVIIVEIIIVPPEVPTSFIIPNFILPLASIDFYFILTVLLLTGLYFSIFNVLKMIFYRERQTIQQ